MKRRRQGRGVWGALVVSVVLVAGLGGAETVAASESPCPPPEGRALCVSVTHTPVDVSSASAGAPTFVAYAVTVRNGGGSTLTHTTANACLTAGAAGACGAVPPGAAFFSATPSAGVCSIAASTARCELGSLAAGAVATIELVAHAPTQAGPFRNVVTVSANERGNDNPGQDPNQDTVTLSEGATALVAGGPRASSFVPKGIATALLAAAGGQSGQSKIPSQHDALTAELAITDDPPFVCPKDEVCRGGGWVSATIPGTFDAGLQFLLHWPDEFVLAKQTEKNFVLFYLACETCELEIIRDRCSSATPSADERPCLWNVRDLGLNGFEATLISSHNGKMH
jgi:Domain of unknown function DUF11